MISSINSGSNAMTMMRSSMQKPPQGKDAFQLSDSDGNGVVSQTELEALSTKITEITGESINVDDALSSYDADSDGGLSGEEMLEMLTSMGFAPPGMENGDEGMAQGPPPPPPPSSEDAISAYSQNSGNDLMSQLLDALGGNEDASTSYSLFSTTS